MLILLLLSYCSSKILPITSENSGVFAVTSNENEISDYYFSIFTESSIRSGDLINIIFPSEFSSLSFTSTSCKVNSESYSCTESDTNIISITLTSTLPSNSRYSILVPSITNPTSGTTGYFAMQVQSGSSGQILDSNDAFAVFFVAPAPSDGTGSVSLSENVVGQSSELTVLFTLENEIDEDSMVQVFLPDGFSFENENCGVVDFSETVAKIDGEFECSFKFGGIMVTGFAGLLEKDQGIGFKFYIKNPAYSMSAAEGSFEIRTLVQGGSRVIDKFSIDSPQIVAGALTSVGIKTLETFNKVVAGGDLYFKLTFKTENEIEDGGSITVDYGDADGNALISGKCVLLQGIPDNSDGESPVCSISGGIATITNFGKISKETEIIILNQVTVAADATLSIKTISSASKTIDESTSDASITTDTDFTKLTLASTVSIVSDRKGSLTIAVSAGPPSASTSTAYVYIPSSITYTGTLVCTIDSTPYICAYSSNIISITSTTGVDFTSCSIKIDTSTANNLKFSTLGSSEVSIFQVAVKIDTFFENNVLDLDPSDFSSISADIALEPQIFSPLIITAKLTNSLDSTQGPYILITFTGFDSDLGSDLADSSSFPFLTSLSAASEGGSVTCTLSTTDSTLKIQNFASISSGTEFTLKFIVKTPAAGSASIAVQAGNDYLNSIQTITDITSTAISFTFAASATAWTSLTGEDLSTTYLEDSASISLSLKPSASSNADDMIFVLLPVGFELSSATALIGTAEMTLDQFENTYAPALLVYLKTKILDSSAVSKIVLNVVNGKYAGAGAGTVDVLLIKNDWTVTNKATVDSASATDLSLTGAIKADFAYSDYEISSTKKTAGDVLFKFFLTFNHSVPTGGSIEITFGSGIDLSYAYCTYSSIFSSSTTCSSSGSKLSITGFSSISSLTASYIKVFNLILPDADTTDSITIRSVYTSGTSHYIDESILDGTALSGTFSTSNTTIELYEYYPSSVGSYSYMQLQFYMDTSVPYSGELRITFPAEVDLPDISDSNCLFNLKFKSCSKSSNTVVIEPISNFPAGISMKLVISGIDVPDNSTSKVNIESVYAGLTLSETSADGTDGFFYSIDSTEASYTGTLNVVPTNRAEKAKYEFYVDYQVSLTDSVLIWFPSTYPSNLGEFYCASTASARIDLKIECSLLQYNLVKATGLAKTGFSFYIFEINNPDNEGNSDNIKLQIVDKDGKVLASSTYSFTVTGLPESSEIKDIVLDNYDINEESQYTILSEVVDIPNEIWIYLPYEFTNEAYGAGDVYTCNVQGTDENFENDQSAASSVTCSNNLYNKISIKLNNPTGSNDYLKTVVSGLKSASIVGLSHFFRMSMLNSDNKIISRTYDYNLKNRVFYTISKQTLVVSSSQSTFVMAPGVSSTYSIYTSSSKVLAKENISITYSIISLNPSSGIVITPSKLTLNKGESSVSFTINIKSSVEAGDFIIKWKSLSLKYSQPKYSLLSVSLSKTYTLSVKNIPELVIGRSTIPIKISTSAAPASSLTISPTGPTGFVFSDIKFSAGSFETSYTITVDSTVSAGSYSIDFELEGEDAEYFELDHSSVNVIVNDHDIEAPSIVSFVINSPRYKTRIDMTLQASEPCMFYYFVGPRGTKVPSNSTLITNAGKESGYYIGYVGATYSYSFSVTGLQGEYDYVLYGLLGDTANNFMSSVFAINLFTQDMDDSIYFTLKFDEPYPSTSDMKGKILNALMYQFVVDNTKLSFSESTQSTATYKLLGAVTDDHPSPVNTIKYTAIRSEINELITGTTLSSSYNIDNSIEIIDNKRPEWLVYPEINATTKDSVLVTFSLLETGTVYGQIFADNATIPSSRQIATGKDAFNEEAVYVYKKKVNAEELMLLEFDGLEPTSSYTLVMTAENNKDPNRYMSDELVAVIDFITQAGTIDTNDTNTDDWAPAFFTLPLLFELF